MTQFAPPMPDLDRTLPSREGDRVIQFREALREAMSEEMRRDPRIFLMGEEVAEYNGAYKVSQGMLEEFGPKRIIDSPISENGFAGIAVGAAMYGLKPIIEFMSWSFSLVAADQLLNNVPKMLYMSGGQWGCSAVFRGNDGAGGQLGSTHSWCVEGLYANVPGVKIAIPSCPYDAKGLLKTAIREKDPDRSIAIIALTAHDSSRDRSTAIAAGCDDFDSKPISMPRLILKVERLLAGRG